MQITSQKINSYTFQITVKESSVELQKARKHVLDEIRADGKVTGFMKGSEIPEEAIIRQYGEPFITSKSIDQYLEKAYPKILRKADITPFAPGNITEMKSTEPLEFTLEIEVLPEVEIDEKMLKTIKVKKTPVSVEEKEIDEEIQAIEKRFTHFHHVGETAHDGAEIQGETANMGDRVTVTAEGYEGKEGESIPETKVPSHPLILGSNAFIPGFEEKLIGAKEGEKVEFEITFPADYHSEKFKSKKVYFRVDIEKIEKPHNPLWDEKFIEGLRGKKTDLAGFRDILRGEITAKKSSDSRAKDEGVLLDKLSQIAKLEVGPALMEREIERVIHDHKANLEEQGLRLENYLSHMKMSEEQYKKDIVTPQAEKRLRGELILMKLREMLAIEVSDEEIAQEVDSMIGLYSNPEVVKRLKEKLVPGDVTYEDIKARAIYKKVIDSFLSE